jgi:hypothetical protein
MQAQMYSVSACCSASGAAFSHPSAYLEVPEHREQHHAQCHWQTRKCQHSLEHAVYNHLQSKSAAAGASAGTNHEHARKWTNQAEAAGGGVGNENWHSCLLQLLHGLLSTTFAYNHDQPP